MIYLWCEEAIDSKNKATFVKPQNSLVIFEHPKTLLYKKYPCATLVRVESEFFEVRVRVQKL